MSGAVDTANMLAVWRADRLDRLLRRAWKSQELSWSGISAGMLCWFQGGITDSFGGFRALHDGLGFLPRGQPVRTSMASRSGSRRSVALLLQAHQRGYAAEDGVALHFVGTRLKEVVSSRAESVGLPRTGGRAARLCRFHWKVRYLGNLR